MKEKLIPCLIAGAIFGLVLWLASGMLWLLPVGLAAGLMGYPLLGITRDESQARKRRDDTFRD
ncbi:hypothetical protein ACUY2X_01355 [Corynebacterium minutissimum]|uniref:hypothetical protein n=1 Tax=Corynebacterium TaxID=1716 RepID=UPI00191F3F8D|nr:MULTISPECIES: hypothetical protein [Corynebacterium]MDK8764456.1 hypothetical protein [Corynebacterium sp. MSK218]QQU95955.1 hypothetical protein I6I66_02215 [Corynebacterium aurimucosum]UTA71146.1 hypothetical protein J3S22_10445 [Corynebacterium aurimucosum]WJY69308.1 hypothetical protein CAURIM_00780 [Corynebacterium aurimucosum]